MIEGTFDIPAYKFAIVNFSCDDMVNYNDLSDYINEYCGSLCFLVPFEDVDGLTLEEIKNFWGKNHNKFALLCYNSYNQILQFGQCKTQVMKKLLFTFDVIPGERIDQAIERVFLEYYGDLSFEYKKIVLCFLERYRFKDKNSVLKRIKEHKENNK